MPRVTLSVFVTSSDISEIPLVNTMPPEERATIALTNASFVRPLEWQDSNENSISYHCSGLNLESRRWPPCIIDFQRLGSYLNPDGSPCSECGPYFIHIWAFKDNYTPVTEFDGFFVRPKMKLYEIYNNNLFELTDGFVPLSSPQPFFNGLNALSLNRNAFLAIQTAYNLSLSKNILMDIRIDTGRDSHDVVYPDESWEAYASPYTLQIGGFLTGINDSLYVNSLCGVSSLYNYCDCRLLFNETICRCMDPAGYYSSYITNCLK